MSKQEKAKKAQGYEAKPVFPMCCNCKWFCLETETIKSQYGTWTKEKGLRCELPDQGLGGFAVKKQGTCNHHQRIEP